MVTRLGFLWVLFAPGAFAEEDPLLSLIQKAAHLSKVDTNVDNPHHYHQAHPDHQRHHQKPGPKIGALLDLSKEVNQLVQPPRSHAPTLRPVPLSATDVPSNAAEAAGVAENAAEDGAAFISALIVNVVTMLVCIPIFNHLRAKYPLTYQNNVNIGTAPTRSLGSTKAEVEAALATRWGWVTGALGATTEETIDSVGLDNAMLLEFCKLGMQMLMYIGVPMICIVGPINCAFGGQPAWEKGDYLSSLSFGNVENGSKLYWMHAFVIWYVVAVIQVLAYRAQKSFLELRFKWLAGLADIRANTVMVEGIPDDFRSDVKLQEFFAGVFDKRNIKSAYMTKDTTTLTGFITRQTTASTGLTEAEAAWKKVDKDPEKRPKSYRHGDLIDYYKAEIKETTDLIKAEKARVKKEASTIQGVNLYTGFVQFTERRYAQMATTQLYSEDRDEWKVECPPEPSDLLWGDMQQSPKGAGIYTTLGYACIAGLYFAYMPLVIGISTISASIDMGPLQSVWAGLAPTIGLQVMVGFLPTFLLLIFRSFFTLKADAWSQKRLQTYYFYFQVVFVVLVTAIGDDVAAFTESILFDPLSLPDLLGATMPGATHFYMNFLVLQWVVHAMNLLRYVMLFKYRAFMYIYDEEEARKKSEPEDQDYYGIGSRSARFTINMVIGIVFGTLSPPINLLCWINFGVCRVVYGYLIPFAETKKPDLGGAFWVDSLKHLFVANIIYCIVMTGVLSGRANMTGFTPTCIAAPSLIYVIWSFRRFDSAFSWEELPITKVADKKFMSEGKKRPLKGTYTQPELD